MKPMMEFLLVAGGGALGAMSRFGVNQLSERLFKGEFPLGTLLVNVTGCLLIGILIGSGRAELSQTWRLAFGIGFLGSLTTFSTFGAETIHSADQGSMGIALANVAANLILGLIAVAAGIWIGKNMITVAGDV